VAPSGTDRSATIGSLATALVERIARLEQPTHQNEVKISGAGVNKTSKSTSARHRRLGDESRCAATRRMLSTSSWAASSA